MAPFLVVWLAGCIVVVDDPGTGKGPPTGSTPVPTSPGTTPTIPGTTPTPAGPLPRDLTAADGRWVSHGADAGEAVFSVGDLDGDGTDDLITDDGKGLRVLHGPPAGELDLGTEPFLATESYGKPLVSPAGDANADGLGDVWVAQGSAVHLLAGPLDADADLTGALATVDTTGDGTTDQLLVGGRDLTGDGEADLLVTEACVYGTDGRVALHAGPFAGPRAPSDAAATFTITAGDQLFGCYGADVGDLDGDGLPEIAIGVADDDYASGPAEGDIGIWSGAATGAQTALDADVILRASAAAVAGFDGDGDGNSDLLLQDFGGFGWVLRGPVLDGATLPDAADATILGMAGATPAPDVDGDGGAELLVTSAVGGRVWLVPGALGGAVGPAEPMWSAVGPLDAHLSAPATGDMDGDGWPDLAVSARGCCATGEGGRVWLISGVGL